MVATHLGATPIKLVRYTPDEGLHMSPEVVQWRIALRSHIWRPPTDVYEADDTIFVRVEIAGMREADFTISLEDRNLLIRGVRMDTPERRAYNQMEIPFGEFSTDVELPCPVVVDGIEAVYKDGFLRISLPKAHPHQVQVEE